MGASRWVRPLRGSLPRAETTTRRHLLKGPRELLKQWRPRVADMQRGDPGAVLLLLFLRGHLLHLEAGSVTGSPGFVRMGPVLGERDQTG